MKKLLFTLLIVAVGGFIAYRAMNNVPDEGEPIEARIAAILEDGGCVSCHTAAPELPFYADFPVMGDMVKKDAADGYRVYDIQPLMNALNSGETPNPVDVAKVEKVLADKRMPMARYNLVHWRSQITNAKRDFARE